jgi:hypothetical protein
MLAGRLSTGHDRVEERLCHIGRIGIAGEIGRTPVGFVSARLSLSLLVIIRVASRVASGTWYSAAENIVAER